MSSTLMKRGKSNHKIHSILIDSPLSLSWISKEGKG